MLHRMAKVTILSIILLLLFILILPAPVVAALKGLQTNKPKLILQITIDQMQGDYPMRYKDRLGEGGFRYLMEKGIHYSNAHYQHADTETPFWFCGHTFS